MAVIQGHTAPPNEECDNPWCALCSAWRALNEAQRQQERERYACIRCGALPDLFSPGAGPLYVLDGRVVCAGCYEQAMATLSGEK